MRFYNFLENTEVLETNVSRFDLEVNGVTSRSDEVKNGYIFVCIKGERYDGHCFAINAKENGASFLVVQAVTNEVTASGLPYVRVASTRAALALMSGIFYGNPQKQLDITAVTGTNGKTSFCRLLAAIYEASGMEVRTLGTLGGGLTTPEPEELFKEFKNAFDHGVGKVVMEASSHGLALDKLYGISFKNTVFTNLTPEHLDFHKTMEAYGAAKSKLFKMGQSCIFNLDDPYFTAVSEGCTGRKYTYSLYDKSASFYADKLILRGLNGITLGLVTPNGRLEIQSPLCGIFNAYNLTAAASAAWVDGIPPRRIEMGLASVNGVNGRLERLDLPDAPFSVFIDYAHTPDALEKVLECVRGFRQRGQRIVLLFGCGGDRDRSKRRVMGQIASRLADFVIVTSDNSRSEKPSDIIAEIMKGIDKERPHTVIEDRAQAIEYAIMTAEENDIILLAGKGHENYEIGMLGRIKFNEKEIAQRALGKRLKENDY